MGSWRSFADFGCPGARIRWRETPTGSLEVEGQGVRSLPSWPTAVDQWWPQIKAVSQRVGIPPHYVAAIMAVESGGKNVCVTQQATICSGAGCPCVQNEGAGLMATLPATASLVLGRAVSSEQLLESPEVAIEAGAKYLKSLLDKYGGDFVAASIGYNAGSIKCGRGSTWTPAGSGWGKEPCPDTGWGVIMGCVYASAGGEGCVPSGGPKPFVCSNLYPARAIMAHNAALQRYGGSVAGAGAIVFGGLFAFGAALGWYLASMEG